MGNSSPHNTKYIVGPASYNINCNDDVLNIDTTLGAVTLYIPNIKNAGLDLYPKCFYVNDYLGTAATNNITIVAVGNDLINGSLSQVIINSNYGSAEAVVNSINRWQVNKSSSGGAPAPAPTFLENIVANPAGGQVGGTLCSANYNSVTTVANSGASLLCASAVVGSLVPYVIQNNSTTYAAYLYPQVGQSFRSMAVNAPISIPPGGQISLICYQAGTWTQD